MSRLFRLVLIKNQIRLFALFIEFVLFCYRHQVALLSSECGLDDVSRLVDSCKKSTATGDVS